VVKVFFAADSGDWAAYFMAMGGAMLPRHNQSLHPFYENELNETMDMKTSEVIQNNLTRYGDIKPDSVVELICKKLFTKLKHACGRKYCSR
jgi:hypothetical protein